MRYKCVQVNPFAVQQLGFKGFSLLARTVKKEIVYLSLHCHHQNDSCINIGSDESHFNVSFIVRDKVTR